MALSANWQVVQLQQTPYIVYNIIYMVQLNMQLYTISFQLIST
jgi:hypothetical protein